jgi:hypothetical protein
MKILFARFHPFVARRITLAAGLALSWSSLDAGPLTGGSYVITGAASSGAGQSSGGPYTLTGWVATAGAGTSQGEDFEITCGLIGAYKVAGGDVALKAETSVRGQVRLWWPAAITGYQLESTITLGPAAHWQAVSPAPSNNSYLVAASQPAQFFRLRKL